MARPKIVVFRASAMPNATEPVSAACLPLPRPEKTLTRPEIAPNRPSSGEMPTINSRTERPPSKTHDLAPRGGLHGLGVFHPRNAQMVERDAGEGGQCGRVVTHQPRKLLGAAAGLETLDLVFDDLRQDAFAFEGEEAQQHDGQSHQRANRQRNHEPSAPFMKNSVIVSVGDAANNGGHGSVKRRRKHRRSERVAGKKPLRKPRDCGGVNASEASGGIGVRSKVISIGSLPPSSS